MNVQEIREAFDEYGSNIKTTNKQPGKLLLISKFLEKVFNVKIENLAHGAEKWLTDEVIGIKGSADVLHGGVVLEIKQDLKKELEDAEMKLIKYLKILRNIRKEEYVGIATDGIQFIAYILTKDLKLKEISEITIDENADHFVLWLDSYFFTRRNIKPSADDLQIRFGLESSTFSLLCEELIELLKKVKDKSHIELKYELWKRHLEIVYGKAPEIEEFVVHTYLITLVKLIMFLRLQGMKEVKNIEKVLDGSYFKEFGITNFIEEDFFTWILEDEIKQDITKLITKLIRELQIYNFEEADEDLFKEIYQDIIGPSARHRIGEFYTPEWLAKLTLLEALRFSTKEFPKILDPACGSGTFLTNAIHLFKEKSKNSKDDLNKILTCIKGIDINPLAVVIARANYIIAIGNLLQNKETEISIPVYVADSIKLPKERLSLHGKIYELEIDKGTSFYFPVKVATTENLLSQILSKMKELSLKLKTNKIDEKIAKSIYENYLETLALEEKEIRTLNNTFSNLLDLVKKRRDTIWIFIFRNFYAPIIMGKEKFDLVIGNPPWIAYRFVENKEYQDFLKKFVFEYELLSSEEIKLFTHMEVATLFFRRCADLYLLNNGIISFVMPRSVLTGAKHHEKFRSFKNPNSKLLEIIDLNVDTSFKVEPLFNVPSCVLIAQKGKENTYPIKTIAYSAKLPKKNAKLEEVKGILVKKEYDYLPPTIKEEKSYYYPFVKQGASLVPRQFWLIDFAIDEKIGINPQKPKVKSSMEALKAAHGIWKEKSPTIEGTVEKEFLFVTFLSKDLKPFGFEKFRPLVLPAKIAKNKLDILKEDLLKKKGFLEMGEWLTKAQRYWEMYASEKEKINSSHITDRINYQGYLTSQNPAKRYVVLYPASGKYLVSCVIDRKNIELSFHEVKITSFIVDTTTYAFETDKENEAYYLSAVLNSNKIDESIKPMQTAGLGGERHIHRRPFEFLIPKFNPKNKNHTKLSELSKECHNVVSTLTIKGRRKVKESLGNYIKEIDKLVEKIM